MPVLIPVKKIAKHCNPFKGFPWEEGEVRKADVTKALKENRLVATPDGTDHAGRIAYLVLNEAFDAIEVDVGIPAIGYAPHWMVQDGNHRLAAAIYAKRESILASVAGQIDYASSLFGVDIAEDN